MRHVLQTPGTRVCGQACLAMLFGLSLRDTIDLVGHRHGTKTKELLRHMRAWGLRPENKLRRKKAGPPCQGIFLLSVRKPPTNWRHWAVMENGVVYDPTYGVGPYPLQFWEEGVRVTSFLQVPSA